MKKINIQYTETQIRIILRHVNVNHYKMYHKQFELCREIDFNNFIRLFNHIRKSLYLLQFILIEQKPEPDCILRVPNFIRRYPYG